MLNRSKKTVISNDHLPDYEKRMQKDGFSAKPQPDKMLSLYLSFQFHDLCGRQAHSAGQTYRSRVLPPSSLL